jgi:hypothetical protein
MLRPSSSRSLARLLKSSMEVLILGVGVSDHSPGGRETLLVHVIIFPELSILMG